MQSSHQTMHARCIAYQTGLIFRTIGLNSERLAIMRSALLFAGPYSTCPFAGRGTLPGHASSLHLDTQALCTWTRKLSAQRRPAAPIGQRCKVRHSYWHLALADRAVPPEKPPECLKITDISY